MLLNLLRRNEYFIVVELPTNSPTVSKELLKWIKNYFWWRGKKVSYYEPYTNKTTFKSSIVAGTPNKPNAIKRSCLIFLLELFAHFEDQNMPLSFKGRKFEKLGYIVTIYKVPKNI